MTPLAITGIGFLSPHPPSPGPRHAPQARDGNHTATTNHPEPLPAPSAHVIADFDDRRTGFKGAAFRSRGTNLMLVACRTALQDSALEVTDTNRTRIGAVIGSAEGSLNSAGSYTKVTLTDPRREHGSPALFPSTVMNHTAAQSAIHYKLSGPNTTIASSRMALLRVLRYSNTLLRRGYADALLAGVVEEFTPYAAWLTHLAEPAGQRGVPAGEGATVLVVEPADRAQAAGRHIDAELLAVTTGFAPDPPSKTQQLSACARTALSQAGLDAAQLQRVVSDDELAASVDTTHLDMPAPELWPTAGECRAASGGLLLAALLTLHRDRPDRDGEHSLLLGADRDGGVGAALFRCWSRPKQPSTSGTS